MNQHVDDLGPVEPSRRLQFPGVDHKPLLGRGHGHVTSHQGARLGPELRGVVAQMGDVDADLFTHLTHACLLQALT